MSDSIAVVGCVLLLTKQCCRNGLQNHYDGLFSFVVNETIRGYRTLGGLLLLVIIPINVYSIFVVVVNDN